jgi:hypothetical protein
MANMELIEAKTSTSSSVTFSSIPQTYTDLKLVCSTRLVSGNFPDLNISFNGSTSNFTNRNLLGAGSGTPTSGTEARVIGFTEGSAQTSSTFSNGEVYIPNYTSSNYKSFSADNVTENNATTTYGHLVAGLWSDVSAITSITISSGANFDSASTFYLYGISNVTSGSKATGGVVSSDGTYWYHTFPFSGTFTPTQSLTADILVVAGGGGGGQDSSTNNGGGGAGGLAAYTSQSLTATGYTVTVGNGGAVNTQGGNSQFGSLTAAVGGGRAGFGTTNYNGGTGGSGGGGAAVNPTPAGTGGTATSGQGNAGGAAAGSPGFCSGGGGGASAVGGNATSTSGGAGGAGSSAYSSWAIATQTGANNGYYAGGGGGSAGSGSAGGVGGLGGGGIGTSPDGSGNAIVNATAGLANTGGGGGGANFLSSGKPGGSGVVIIRYAA